MTMHYKAYDESEALVHHGVLGMKWGVRKDGMPQGWQGPTKGPSIKSTPKQAGLLGAFKGGKNGNQSKAQRDTSERVTQLERRANTYKSMKKSFDDMAAGKHDTEEAKRTRAAITDIEGVDGVDLWVDDASIHSNNMGKMAEYTNKKLDTIKGSEPMTAKDLNKLESRLSDEIYDDDSWDSYLQDTFDDFATAYEAGQDNKSFSELRKDIRGK